MKTLKTLAMAACLSLATAAAGFAATMDFQFSFTGSIDDGSPSVVGIVRGLEEGDNAVDTVEIISNSLGYGIGTYTNSGGAANWTVTGGTVTAWDFLSFGGSNASPDVTDSSLFLSSSILTSGLSQVTFSVSFVGSSLATFEQITPVPLPAAGGMLALGLIAMGAAGKRRKATA